MLLYLLLYLLLYFILLIIIVIFDLSNDNFHRVIVVEILMFNDCGSASTTSFEVVIMRFVFVGCSCYFEYKVEVARLAPT